MRIARIRKIKILSCLAIAATSITVASTNNAAASPAQPLATRPQLILDCLQDGYVSGNIENMYAKATGLVYYLKCGTAASYGVLHIDSAHDIPANLTSTTQFYNCFGRLIGSGVTGQAPLAGTTKWYWPDRDHPKVLGYTQDSTRIVNTVFTPGNDSNNWASCSQ